MKILKEDFPLLSKKINGKNIIYLDSACQTLRPNSVINEINAYYKELSSCSGRSSHILAKETTQKIESSRNQISKFFNTKRDEEIVFTKNSTEGINLIANTIGLKKSDVIITTNKEHNSNLIPWIHLENKIGIKRKFINFDYEFDMESFEKIIKNKYVKLVSMLHTSNVDGTSIPIKEIIEIAHENDVKVLIDGAQSAPTRKIDVKKLDMDFFVASSHKMLGPSGVGILYGKYDLLKNLDNFILGGDTVTHSTYNSFIMQPPPKKFEAGLQNYAGIIGFKKAIEYIKKVGQKNITNHIQKLNKLVTKKLNDFEKIDILGNEKSIHRSSIFSFNVKGFYPKDISSLLEKSSNIMLRSGYHCAHSYFNAKKLNGSVRASFYIYNNEDDCKIFTEEIEKLLNFIN